MSCTPDAITCWFSEFEQLLDAYDLKEQPQRIWNTDDSGFPLCRKSGKVIAYSHSRAVYGVTENSKEQITTLCHWCSNPTNAHLPW